MTSWLEAIATGVEVPLEAVVPSVVVATQATLSPVPSAAVENVAALASGMGTPLTVQPYVMLGEVQSSWALALQRSRSPTRACVVVCMDVRVGGRSTATTAAERTSSP